MHQGVRFSFYKLAASGLIASTFYHLCCGWPRYMMFVWTFPFVCRRRKGEHIKQNDTIHPTLYSEAIGKDKKTFDPFDPLFPSWWFNLFEKKSQIGNLPGIEVKIKTIWNHHLVFFWLRALTPFTPAPVASDVRGGLLCWQSASCVAQSLVFNNKTSTWKMLHGEKSELFGMVKWPFKGVVGDLQLGDQKVTLNHLVHINTYIYIYILCVLWLLFVPHLFEMG